MTKSKTKSKKETKFRDDPKKWIKEFWEGNKVISVIISFIILMIIIGVIYKIVNAFFVFFLVTEIILIVALVILVLKSEKVRNMWKELSTKSKVFYVIFPLVLLLSTIWIGTLNIGDVPSILQIGKSTNPVESSSEDPLIFQWDNYTTVRTHTLELEVEGESLILAELGSPGIVDNSSVKIEFFMGEYETELDVLELIFSQEKVRYELEVYGSEIVDNFFTKFYWNSSDLFVPELEKIYLFQVTISDYEGDITEGEQWFYYLEDVPLDIGDYKWIIIGAAISAITITITVAATVKIRKKKKTKKVTKK